MNKKVGYKPKSSIKSEDDSKDTNKIEVYQNTKKKENENESPNKKDIQSNNNNNQFVK